jgi:hypothetical protein
MITSVGRVPAACGRVGLGGDTGGQLGAWVDVAVEGAQGGVAALGLQLDGGAAA